MKLVKYEIEVIEDNCTGCYLCENICPTNAIVLEGPRKGAIAKVNNDLCVACFRCIDICDDAALLSHERAEPRQHGTDPASVDQKELATLLMKTKMLPDSVSCVCAGVTNREIAAAIVAGNRTFEEVALATGTQSGCLMYCLTPIHRMLMAQYGSIPEPKMAASWYPTSQHLADYDDATCEAGAEFGMKTERDNYLAELRAAVAAIHAGVAAEEASAN